MNKTIKSYKGFDKDMKCRGFQFKEGETYTHEGKVERCGSGFHACEYPLDVFSYYPPGESIYHEVIQSGDIDKCANDDSKVASSVLEIKGSIDFHGMVSASIDFILSRCKKDNKKSAHRKEDYSAASNTGYRSAASNTGDYSAASNTGYRSAASNTGDYSAASNTGDYSAASNTGYRSAASNTGYRSAASNTGYRSAASNTGYRSAASNTGDYSAASNTGDYSAASNTGDYSAASNTGDYSAASNTGHHSAASNTGHHSAASIEGDAKESVAIVTGYQSKAKASKGNWIVLTHRNDDYEITHIVSKKAGTKGCKADTWYTLNSKGKLEEVK